MQTYVFPAYAERVPTGGYSLFFEDLPGCITAAADLTGLAARAEEALQLHLEGMTEDGELIPQPTPPEQLSERVAGDIVAVLLVQATAGPVGSVTLSLSLEALRQADAAAGARGETREQVLTDRLERLLAAE